ncbi:MAG: transcription-repair coupling factor [Bacteroidota bacterium]
MSLKSIQQQIYTLDLFPRLSAWLEGLAPNAPEALQVKGLAGSLSAFVLAWVHREQQKPLICMLPNADAAAYLVSDLEQVGGEELPLLHLQPSGLKPYDPEQMADAQAVIARADVLQQLSAGFTGIFVTSLEAAYEKVPDASNVKQETQTISIGETNTPNALFEQLVKQLFNPVEFVAAPGEIALRGGILDVFPFAGTYPIRIEFFGDEIDSIREFDVHSQRSISRLKTARLIPNLDNTLAQRKEASAFKSIFSYFPEDVLLALFNSAGLEEQATALFEKAQETYNALAEATQQEDVKRATHALPPEARFVHPDAFTHTFLLHPRLLLGTFSGNTADEVITAETRPQPSFNGNLRHLRNNIQENHLRQVRTYILCDNRGQEARMLEILEDEIERGQVELKVESLHEGFMLPDTGLAVYTDHQIFNRFHRPTTRKQRKKHGGISLRELRNLSPGDFVVHIDYGIGKFAGLQQITVRNKQQEAVRMLFRDNDVLYVNVNALYKLHKFTGKEGHQPRLTKLGSGQWERTKSRTKKRVKDIARDLIKLYAKRKASSGFAFKEDTLWQRELEASFKYEDTPDQRSAAEAVKRDMEQGVPMDRLVCGDVGFGKTEIAVRAAFKAVQDGKQVAILVPTTILASQHTKTFANRLGQFPVRVAELSRFRTSAEQKETLKQLKAGTVDIIVGTHRLLSKDIAFKNLGLLIIDEEQRFGVSAKEKLRALRAEVDTLCLTATPIPRTLQFSLMGARDLSIMTTPPPNRQPIVTEIHTFDKDLIRDAILHETNRGGQVFFVHNRVQNIEEISDMIRMLIPNIRIQVGHGQMKPAELERVMTGFIQHKFDVLVSTNIVESGVDISNANTMIINRANHFGLADLHQLRGRVGRSDQKAFCYLLVPSIHSLTREAKQRLQAVEEFSDLGSGFNIAMRDLDIRGAGNLLGAEQSGFIADVGYETYHRILDEAVQELRSEEFKSLFKDAPPPPAADTVIDVEEDAYIPDAYLSNSVERLNLYRRLSEASDNTTLDEMQKEMEDRFGPLPKEVEHLLMATGMRNTAQRLRLSRLVYKNQRLFLVFPNQKDDAYFYELLFQPLLKILNDASRRYVLKENKAGKLRAIVQDVPTLKEAYAIIKSLAPLTEKKTEESQA